MMCFYACYKKYQRLHGLNTLNYLTVLKSEVQPAIKFRYWQAIFLLGNPPPTSLYPSSSRVLPHVLAWGPLPSTKPVKLPLYNHFFPIVTTLSPTDFCLHLPLLKDPVITLGPLG